MRGSTRLGAAAVLCLLLAGCGQDPVARPTIGSPAPQPSVTDLVSVTSGLLSEQWQLTGVPLPDDWPDVPLPRGTEVITAYAIGEEPRRTWTATFAGDGGTALDIAEPVVSELRRRGYTPIAEYVGAPATNTGLYSFAAPTFAIYVVLGEDDGRPNVVITIRGSNDPQAGLSSGQAPTPAGSGPSVDPTGALTPTSSGPPTPGQGATPGPTASPSPTAPLEPTATPTA